MKRTIVVVAGLCAVPSPVGSATPAEAQTNARVASDSQVGRWRFDGWPALIRDPQGVFLYATEAASVGISPYQNNLAIGYKTLNPTTHRSPLCNSSGGFEGFCGDEVAYGAYTLSRDVTGRDNTAIGDHALANLVSGTGNTAVGSSAAANIRTSGGVDAFGVAACQNAIDYAGPITCIGQASLEFAEPSSRNTVAVGYQAGLYAKDAQFSTLVGMQSGFSALINTHSVVVGFAACNNVKAILNSICIGTVNGPVDGSMVNKLWIGGKNGTAPILFGDLATNALGVNTTTLAPGAGLTLARGNMALQAGFAVQWNGDAGLSRTAAGKLAIGNGVAANDEGTLELRQVSFSSRANISAPAPGELRVGAGDSAGTSGHIVAAYVRTVPTKVAALATIDPSPAIGDRAMVTDAKACAFGVAVAGLGSTMCPIYYNGTSWIAG